MRCVFFQIDLQEFVHRSIVVQVFFFRVHLVNPIEYLFFKGMGDEEFVFVLDDVFFDWRDFAMLFVRLNCLYSL